MLKGSYRKYGFDRFRYVFCGFCKSTGQTNTFFIELEYLNPLLSPKKTVLGFSSEYDIKPQDIQSALTTEQSNLEAKSFPPPSFVCIRAGIIHTTGKQVANYFPFCDVTKQKNKTLQIGKCTFSPSHTTGEVALSQNHILQKSAFLCNTGVFSWNLSINKIAGFDKICKSKTLNWVVTGGRTAFSGSIFVDGLEYTVTPAICCGYIEHDWGQNLPAPYFHIHSCKLNSIITGAKLLESFFAVYGTYNGDLAMFSVIQNEPFCFFPNKNKNKKATWDCLEAPDDTKEKKLHWSASFQNKNYILDIDIYCKENQMFVKDYEQPLGNRKVLKVLGGAAGYGEIRLYKHYGKTTELIEHANIESCFCEYGAQE